MVEPLFGLSGIILNVESENISPLLLLTSGNFVSLFLRSGFCVTVGMLPL